MIKHLKIKVFGLVQGVLFRQSARAKALELNLTGFVRNLSDGSVYLDAEGEEAQLLALLDWCRRGPPAAEVQKVEFKYLFQIKGDCDFKIK